MRFLSNFGCKMIFMCSVNFGHQQDSSLLFEESIGHVTSQCKWPIKMKTDRDIVVKEIISAAWLPRKRFFFLPHKTVTCPCMSVICYEITQTLQVLLVVQQRCFRPFFVGEHINADDVIAFCLYLMNKMRWNLIKIRLCAIVY